MALNKTLIKKKQELNYWRITSYVINPISKKASFFLSGYINKTDRTNDEEHPSCMDVYHIDKSEDFNSLFDITEMNKVDNNPVKALYEYAKNNIADFKDATDI